MRARLAALPHVRISEGPDAVVWPAEANQRFSVRSFRRLLYEGRFPGSTSFPTKVIWARWAPTKVQFFCWLTFKNRIATVDNLKKRDFALPNRCVMCEQMEETVDHLFPHCTFASQVWSKLSSTLFIIGLIPSSVRSLFEMWKDMNCKFRSMEARKVILHGFFWHLWVERNERLFQNSKHSAQQVFMRFWVAIVNWLHAFGQFDDSKQREWVRLSYENG
ncbi:hypothetical protein LINPERPRIM_LOCUS7533 [Linum perenne]